LRRAALRLITAVGHKRGKHPHSMSVAFEHLGQALPELSFVLSSRPVPFRTSFPPGFVEFEAYGEIDGRFGDVDDILMTRAAIRRTRFCTDIRSVL
jgi:hypothetical protein